MMFTYGDKRLLTVNKNSQKKNMVWSHRNRQKKKQHSLQEITNRYTWKYSGHIQETNSILTNLFTNGKPLFDELCHLTMTHFCKYIAHRKWTTIVYNTWSNRL